MSCGGGGSEPTGPVPPPVGAAAVAQVVVSPGSDTSIVGTVLQLAAVLKDSAGNTLTSRPITWTTSSPAVATVSSSGLATLVGIGRATIAATAEGKSGSVQVTAVPLVRVGRELPSLFAGDTTALTTALTDIAGHPLGSATAAWTSSAPAVATVSSAGVVTGLAPGLATITATESGSSGSQVVSVLARGLTHPDREISYRKAVTRAADGFTISTLWTVRPDGSADAMVSAPDENLVESAWSPDGARIVLTYVMSSSGGPAIGRSTTVVVNADGTGEQTLRGFVTNPAWSPDGTRIVYRDLADLYVMNETGGGVRQLTTAAGDDLDPQWSPDGRQILFIHGDGELWLMSADGSHQRRLFMLGASANGTWSPDGKQIYFSAGSATANGVWRIGVDGAGLVPITPNCTLAGSSTISCTGTAGLISVAADGLHIVYEQSGELFTADPDGGNAVSFPTQSCCQFRSLAPSPSGGYFAVDAFALDAAQPEVGLVSTSGGGWQVVVPPGNVSTPAWRP